MKVVAAVLLAALGGNSTPCVDDINDILGSVGIECDSDRIESLLGQLKGRDLIEVIAAGRDKIAAVPSGGGVAVAASGGGGGGAAAPAAAPQAEAKKEEKVEEKEESDDDMGFSLFD
ncbi:hypothetical protein SUGI_1019890 [Cryptomeria japonica]|uniref:large ribosomal subunit protein P2z n=1 Tax=Cryptomeria japonica TaxID=3369 RepID=UPI002414AC2F|nr:large ribosomal subunit protein P2z [Cryptomeria japonica]GLJ48317.1 hypothetical protein SUGI_1019890 [Cryptomeria japonica]